ncbi:MAG: hypothetical protein EOP34_10565 [Rickettsiales bacterium]|nr:MAG: hypothetical protein EOP34_10565 [Rickettsiales bacterium]
MKTVNVNRAKISWTTDFNLTIPKNGTIVIPKKVRDLLHTNNITIQVDEASNISIIPVKNLKGRLSKYSKSIESSQDKSEVAWNMHLKDKYSDTNIILRYLLNDNKELSVQADKVFNVIK